MKIAIENIAKRNAVPQLKCIETYSMHLNGGKIQQQIKKESEQSQIWLTKGLLSALYDFKHFKQ